MPFRTALLTSTVALTLVAAPAPSPGLVPEPGGKAFGFRTQDGLAYRISFPREDVFRIQAAPGGKFQDPLNDPKKAQILVDTALQGRVKVATKPGQAVFTTAKLVLTVDLRDGRMSLADAAGKPLWEQVRPLTRATRDVTPPPRKEGETPKAVPTAFTTLSLSAAPDEHFFGGGQQNGAFSHRGTKVEIRADGNWNEGGRPNPSPFFLSSKGYGILRHTFSTGTYDFTTPQAIHLEHQEDRLDAYCFVGGSIPRVVDLYTQFTGRPNFVNIWALELGEADAWMTRDKKTKELLKDAKGDFVEITPHVVPKLAEQYRKHDFPGGWILPNDGYGCGYQDLPEVVQRLKGLGFYTGLWTERALDKIKWEVGTAGTRVQKLDVAWTWPAYQFSLDANKTAFEGLTQNSDSRGLVWTVQGWAGTQRYAVCWTGDQYGSWDLIRYHIPTLIGSGLSGQAYATTDVDGIFGGSPETYTRDLQWKCFTPVLYVMNGWSDVNKSPFAYPEPYKSINREYLKLKMRLTPYMYKYTREAWDTGAPIVRGLLWNFPGDPKTYDKRTQYQYLLGDWMLVAPVFTSMNVNRGHRREPIYLPQGAWFDHSDGRLLQGPLEIQNYPITLEKLPLFLRGGAIVPMYPEMLYNDQKPKDPLTFDVYPWGQSSFELYEDDGLTRQYQKGAFARQKVTCEAPEGKSGDITLTVHPSVGQFQGKLTSRVYQFQVRTPFKPASITVDGQPLLALTEAGAFASCVAAWHFDAQDKGGTVHIRLARTGTDKTVKVHLDVPEGQAWPQVAPWPEPKATAELDKTSFTLKASSSYGGAEVGMAFDGTPETYWHTKSKAKPEDQPLPATLDIGLNARVALNGLRYLPRPKSANGRIKDYEILAGRTPETLKVVASGTWPNSEAPQTVTFPTIWAEHVRLVARTSHTERPVAAVAELDLLQDLQAAPEAAEVTYLSDLQPEQATGTFQKDRSAGGRALTVNGQTYTKGLGVKAPSELVYRLDGSWKRLSGHVGVDGEVGTGGSVVFRVYADGKLLFESPVMGAQNVKQLMELSLQGARELKLVLHDNGDGQVGDHGDWVDVKLVR